MPELDSFSRERLDFSEGPNGETIAVLTVSLGDGTVHRYRSTVTPEELDNLGAAFAAAEAREMQISGEFGEDQIAGFFGSITKGFKKIGGLAKKVVTSKVFRAAGKGLAMAAPALGPFAPAALAVSAGFTVSSKLGAAATAAEGGAKRVARKLARKAAKFAGLKVRGKKGSRLKLMRWANKKRKRAAKLAKRRTKRGAKRRTRPKATRRTATRRTARRRTTRPNVLKLAQAGKLRSNRKGTVSASTLARAAKSGRVFWLAA